MRRGGGDGKAVRVALSLVGLVVVLLGLAQLFLPKLAASQISSRIGKYGKVKSVHVSAWPAVELLWGEADSVDVRASRLRMNPGQTAKLLDEARGVDRLDLSVEEAHEGPLRLVEVALRKRGKRLSAHGYASNADVRAALPPGFGVELLGSSGGKVEVRASGGLFGVGASVDAIAEASDGKLVVHPRGLLVEALRLTLFSDSRVRIEGVAAERNPAGYYLGIAASLP